MPTRTVDEYVRALPAEQAEIVSALRRLVRSAAPKAVETVKWAQPVYEQGGPLIFIKAHKAHINFGFWRGAEMADPGGLLQGDGDRMRHIKLTSRRDIRPTAFKALVRQAVRLNTTKGDPTRKR